MFHRQLRLSLLLAAKLDRSLEEQLGLDTMRGQVRLLVKVKPSCRGDPNLL